MPAKTAGKAGPGALQIEVNTEEEWQELLTREGLTVVDVYSDWSGACVAMTSTLKKIKMEINSDVLEYAVARNENIGDLARFRGRSEPTWMFLQDGKMVNLIFGAHCPYLRKLVTDEIKRVQSSEAPKWTLDVSERVPEEETRWQAQEAIRNALEEEKQAREDAEKKEKYERFMEQMVFELCEETALVLYPWVFKDEKGRLRDKQICTPYTELVQDLFKQCYDVQEEARIQLNVDLIDSMFVESDVKVSEELIEGLCDGKCLAMRLKGKPPHPDWPVQYPYESPDLLKKGPIRAIDDVENYLVNIITKEPPPFPPSADAPTDEDRPTYDEPYIERHVYVHEADPEIEGDVQRAHPVVWTPLQARSKVHVFKTLFPAYMERAHPYEEPVAPLPLCGFKFDGSKFGIVRDAYELHSDAVERFGVFEFDRPSFAKLLASAPEDFERKVKYKTGAEVLVLIIRRTSEEAFLAFAGVEPFFVTEIDEEAEEMIREYFPEQSADAASLTLDKEEISEEEEDLEEKEVDDIENLEEVI